MQNPVVKMFETPIPESILGKSVGNGSSKYQYLFDALRSMPKSGHIEVVFPNKEECRKAQSNISAREAAQGNQLAFPVITRTYPTNGRKDGQWTLYAQYKSSEQLTLPGTSQEA